MFDLFGAEMPLAVRFFLAFLIVLGLIGAAAWAVRRFGSARLGGAVRGRQPRLAVIEYATVDARRRLLLVRRDNVEHLMMIGGPSDVVVESNIVRAVPALREPVGAASAGAGRYIIASDSVAGGRIKRFLAAATGATGTAGAPGSAAARATDRANTRRTDERTAAVSRAAAAPAARSSERARRRPRRTCAAGGPRSTGHAAAAAQPPAGTAAIGAGRSSYRASSGAAHAGAATGRGACGRRSKPRRNGAAARSGITQAKSGGHAGAGSAAPSPEPQDEAEDVAASAPPPPPPRPARPAEAKPVRAEAKAKEGVKEGKALYDTLEQEMASLLGRPASKN